jgi:hypothetical protein
MSVTLACLRRCGYNTAAVIDVEEIALKPLATEVAGCVAQFAVRSTGNTGAWIHDAAETTGARNTGSVETTKL